jgi:hypothetical protein
MVLALLLAASAHTSCDALWDRAWKDFIVKNPPAGLPLFKKVKGAEKKLRAAWLTECGRFSKATLACARGEDLEQEIALARKQLEAEKVPAEEIEKLLAKLRAQWSILDCRDVDRAFDRAAERVAADEGL